MQCMKISQLVIDTFIYQIYKFGFLSRYKVAKWGVNGNADFTAIRVTFRGEHWIIVLEIDQIWTLWIAVSQAKYSIAMKNKG
jgi:hypothetical protein